MPRGSFGGDKWLEYLYPVNTLDWPALLAQRQLPPVDQRRLATIRARVSARRRSTLDLRHPTDPHDAIDPDLQPMEQEEFQIGADWQWTAQLGPRLPLRQQEPQEHHRRHRLPDHRSGHGRPREVYITGNPGKGLVAGDPDGAGPIPAQPEAIRDYEADRAVAGTAASRTTGRPASVTPTASSRAPTRVWRAPTSSVVPTRTSAVRSTRCTTRST